MLVGFDRTTPAQQRLIAALQEKSVNVEVAETVHEDSPAEPGLLVEATNGKDEVATCALWVRSQLETLGSAARLAVVVPGVAAKRPEIERTFRQILAPQTTMIGGRDLPLPFEFSLGVPLSQLPIVRAALLLLRWMDHGLLPDQVSWLLLSGLICRDEAEVLSLARFDARLRQQPMRPPEQDLESFLQSLDRGWSETASLTGLRRRLIAAQRALGSRTALSFAEWVQRAGEILEEVHWPGAHARQSEDFQVQARWSQLLDSLAGLAFDGRTVRYSVFLDVLERQASRTIYAPESLAAPVQILGPFEAAGLQFDALWFLGADDAGWPPVARPHPFLSRSLQRKHEMPHAHSDVDWKLAEQVTTRLKQSAGKCVFSYAAQDAEGVCRPSTLVSGLKPPVQAEQVRIAIGAEEDLATMHDFPAVVTDAEPAVAVPWPLEKEAGGADVLQHQAACPFRSFAIRRLSARPLDETDWGLDPRAHGKLVHTLLDKVWAALVDRHGLVRARTEGGLPALLASVVDESLETYRVSGEKRPWNEAYLATARARILSLMEEWLLYEETRADFSVEAREEKRSAPVGDLKLQVRVDRVDRVQGGRVIIDYKTGVVKTDAWDGPRPDEPQLPIYAGFGQVENLQGVLLGRVADERLGFSGRVADSNAVLPGSLHLSRPPYTAATLEEWRNYLLDLAAQFVRGEAQVDPKRYPKTCQYCALPGLCRIAETERARGVEDAEEPA